MDDPAPIYEAAELLARLRAAAKNPETVVGATLELVAGQRALRAAESLTRIRAELKASGLSGDSSVGTIRAACRPLLIVTAGQPGSAVENRPGSPRSPTRRHRAAGQGAGGRER